MSTSRFQSIPRFALPYTASDFAAGARAIFHQCLPPDAFEFLGPGPKFWTRSGRQALCLLLKALKLKPGSGVAVPLFTDPSLFKAIIAAGHEPVFIDIQARSLTMDPQRLYEARGAFSAVVAVHLFGQLANMSEIMIAAGSVPVIEDTAHAPLSFLNGRIAGGFGVASFYSFASTKYWPAGGGGLAVLNDESLRSELARAVESLRPARMVQELRNLFLQAAKAAVFHRRVYGSFGKPLRSYAEPLALLEPSLDSGAVNRSWAAVARRQAARLPDRVERQRANSLRLLGRLGGLKNVTLPNEGRGARSNYHMFPVLLRNGEERAAILVGMWRKFVDASTIYSRAIEEARSLGYSQGCPMAESAAERLITLPNYASLSANEIDYVARVFVSSLYAIRCQPVDRGGMALTRPALPAC